MKVLFAVSNESISDSIIKKYQQEYKEIISSKNVYYFNAITKELQKDKSYDRIVISEDLEPFANNNYEVIDKFIFEKLDSISDEATSNNGQDIPIILICADRRDKSESLLVKIFGIGIYSALLGQDRSVSNVCELIHKPRSKKDAKIYYRIESEDVDYKSEGEGEVSEIEIQNILNHYKRLGKNEEQYVSSFDNIATQYTDAQLRVICKFLPLNVKAVLEANSQKYQELITFGTVTPSTSAKEYKAKQDKYVPNNDYQKQRDKKKKAQKMEQTVQNLDIIEKNIGKSNLTKPVVIPSSRNITDVKKVNIVNTPNSGNMPSQVVPNQNMPTDKAMQKHNATTSTSDIDKAFEDIILNIQETVEQENKNTQDVPQETTTTSEAPKKRRGRPRKVQPEVNAIDVSPVLPGMESNMETVEAPKKKRGRPRKIQPQEEINTVLPGFEDNNKIDTGAINLFDLGNEEEGKIEQPSGGIILPGFDDEEEETNITPNIPRIEEQQTSQGYVSQSNIPQSDFNLQSQYGSSNYSNSNYTAKEVERTNQYQDINLDNLLTRDKKIVAFVGTSKNGTSFLVNNLAETLSKKGIRTAILDLTKNKNAYYIYTQNEEELRKKAFSCVQNLRNGIVDGIQVNKNLTVYTTVPEENEDIEDYQNILKTLAQNYSLVLMDCDFETNYGYFKNAQEIYLVQSFDILTIQPLTAFLRDLKTKNILNPEKLRIVLNKVLRVRSVTERTIIGGMAFYNDPAMSFMTELFNKDTVKYCSIPFEEQTYSRYLEGLVNCQISTNGYSKNFMMNLEKLSNMVYPLLSNNDKNAQKMNSYRTNGFSSNMNETLNKMKNNY